MFVATDSGIAPSHVAKTDDKKRGRLNIISHLITQIPYEELESEKVELPKRQKPGDYRDLASTSKRAVLTINGRLKIMRLMNVLPIVILSLVS